MAEPRNADSAAARPLPLVWSIAGSDSGGGAGIQADLKTINALGAHGCTVVTALTAQHPGAVLRVEPTSEAMLAAQFEALRQMGPPAAVKVGMLGNAATVTHVAEALAELASFVVCDPVMVSTSGAMLLEPDTVELLKTRLLPHVDLLTPNLPEVQALTGQRADTPAGVESAARALIALGVGAVLIKGGHGSGQVAQDYWTDGSQAYWLSSPRLAEGGAHGTGCCLASAIAAGKATGMRLLDALVQAKAYVNQGLRLAVAHGDPGIRCATWPGVPGDLPWLTASAAAGQERLLFPDCGEDPLGFYPVVDSADWLERLLPQGVTTAQLRVKHLQGTELRNELERGIALARTHGCRLFINDYWALAMELGAYGVHLGQEDLDALTQAELASMAQAGLRLGVSTHCYHEVARALAVRPSYIAIGPIFRTMAKPMPFQPQGLEGLRLWRHLLDYPLVAIGGIPLDRAGALYATGATSVAVISDVTKAADPEARTRDWVRLNPLGARPTRQH